MWGTFVLPIVTIVSFWSHGHFPFSSPSSSAASGGEWSPLSLSLLLCRLILFSFLNQHQHLIQWCDIDRTVQYNTVQYDDDSLSVLHIFLLLLLLLLSETTWRCVVPTTSMQTGKGSYPVLAHCQIIPLSALGNTFPNFDPTSDVSLLMTVLVLCV